MKKMLSLAAMFAVLSYASPASAELKIGGDAAVRLRSEFTDTETNNVKTSNTDELKLQYRIRLKASADLGSGYFFKTMIQNESNPGSWVTVAGNPGNNDEHYALEVSNFYFGRVMECSHYQIGRLPLNSVNNPIFDLTLVPIPAGNIYAVDIPVATYSFDRVFGLNYGTKVGNGDLNATLVVLDNDITLGDTAAEGDGIFNDGYALHLAYKTSIGDVTLEPQALIALTDVDGGAYQNVSPNTFGANVTIPAGKSKIGMSGFYTVCDDTNPNTSVKVDYNGYLLRLKGESGPVMAWVDYNHTNDNSPVTDVDYDNLFVWAQYNFKVHESAMGSFSLTPTIRYRASGKDNGLTETDNNQLRGELYATVTF
jgi:predicted porin